VPLSPLHFVAGECDSFGFLVWFLEVYEGSQTVEG